MDELNQAGVDNLLQSFTNPNAVTEQVMVKPKKVKAVKEPKVKAEKVAKVVEPTKPKVPSKADHARSAFVEMTKTGSVRKDVIKAFIELGLTKDGAATYYYNCTKARKAGKL